MDSKTLYIIRASLSVSFPPARVTSSPGRAKIVTRWSGPSSQPRSSPATAISQDTLWIRVSRVSMGSRRRHLYGNFHATIPPSNLRRFARYLSFPLRESSSREANENRGKSRADTARRWKCRSRRFLRPGLALCIDIPAASSYFPETPPLIDRSGERDTPRTGVTCGLRAVRNPKTRDSLRIFFFNGCVYWHRDFYV